MPGTADLDALHPWPGLASYDESARDFFQGRAQEAEALERLVMLAPLVALYGRSGLGKSSLLKAGLFPRLRRAGFLPVYVRIDFSPGNAIGAIEQIARQLEQEIAAQGLDGPAREPGETPWHWLHRKDFELWTSDNQLTTPVLVLDQFEELFSRSGGDPQRIAGIVDELADLAENRIAADLGKERGSLDGLDTLTQRYRMLLSFREDFLAEMRSWNDKLRSLFLHELRLKPMTIDQAERSIEQAGRAVLAPGAAHLIVNFLAGQARAAPGGEVTIEPALLSLTCTQLNLRRGERLIDATLVDASAHNILEDFYRDALADMPEGVRRFIEDKLLQGERTRGSYAVDEALQEGFITRAQLEILTTERRLLRIETQHDIARVELIHDRLVDVVRAARQAREDAQAAEEARNDERMQAESRLAEERAARERDEREALERIAAEQTARARVEEAARASAEADAKRLRRGRNALVVALIVVAVLLAATVLQTHTANTLRVAETKAREQAEKDRKLAELRLAQAKQVATTGWVGDATTSVDEDQLNQSYLANAALQKMLAASSEQDRARRARTTVEIFAKDVDGDKVRKAMAELGFNLYNGKTAVKDLATNALWFGRTTEISDVKLVALALMRAGVQLRSIHPIQEEIAAKVDPNLIQVGANAKMLQAQPYTVDKLLAQQQFTRE